MTMPFTSKPWFMPWACTRSIMPWAARMIVEGIAMNGIGHHRMVRGMVRYGVVMRHGVLRQHARSGWRPSTRPTNHASSRPINYWSLRMANHRISSIKHTITIMIYTLMASHLPTPADMCNAITLSESNTFS